jgi:DNA-binding response OmpR family regulator
VARAGLSRPGSRGMDLVMSAKILVVDDEPDALELIAFNLKPAGFEVLTAADGETALKLARTTQPALIVLDLMLPQIDGLEVCKILRRDPATAAIPIVMVTAKTGEIDRVLGLELGADDYVTKPFSPRELVLRVKRLLIRRAEAAAEPPERIQIGDLMIDLPRQEVRVGNKKVDLTATEFKLLTILAQSRGRVQTREFLLREVWEYDSSIETRTVDTHVHRLRDKLGRAAPALMAVRGLGYRFAE